MSLPLLRLPRVIPPTSLAVFLLLTEVDDTFAGGFEIREQGASSVGAATAGMAASGEDASTAYYNPAAMTLLDESQVALAGQLFVLDLDYNNRSATDGGGSSIVGSDTMTNEPIVVPSLFGVWKFSDQVRLGFSLTAPFGLVTEYDEDWVGRYNTYYSGLQTLDFNPAVAIRITDWLSIGAGGSVQYAKGERRNMLDFGSICLSGLDSAACAALGLSPQAADGRLELTADGWGFGYNVGILLQPTPEFRVGVAYRSAIHQHLHGTADFTVPTVAEPLTAGGALFQDSGASTDITLPERVSVSLYYELRPGIALLGDVTWTAWSRFDELRIEFDNPAQPSFSEAQNWDDSFRYSIGARYQVTDELVARIGFAYDETPIDSDLRNPGIPGNDRLVFALGAGYRLSDAISIDTAYTFNYELEASVDQSRPDGGTIDGDYNNRTHILSAQLVWRF